MELKEPERRILLTAPELECGCGPFGCTHREDLPDWRPGEQLEDVDRQLWCAACGDTYTIGSEQWAQARAAELD